MEYEALAARHGHVCLSKRIYGSENEAGGFDEKKSRWSATLSIQRK